MADPGSRATSADPKVVGNYRVEGRIASGHLTQVFRATSLRSGVPVCLKLLKPGPANQRGVVDRFVASARALLGVQLPHVVTVRDAGTHEGLPFLVTDLIDGQDLGTVIGRGGPIRPGAALSYLAQVAKGLDAAAGLGQLHGDLRPGHLLMQRGRIYVIGFGRTVPWTTAQGRQTWGEAAYMPPEVASGRRPDLRSDIYSLGCTGFELVTGRPPFGEGPPDAVLACHAHEPFPSARRLAAHVPEAVDALLQRMGAKNANQRPQDYASLVQEIQALAHKVSAGTSHPPILIVESGRQVGTQIEVPEGSLLLGRTPGEGMVIDDGRISRRHALLHRQGQRVTLEDLGSRNGIKVNGARAATGTVLRHGDRLELGDTVLRIENCEGVDDPVNEVSAEGVPSSPVRGAFGASEVSNPPARQQRLAGLEDDLVVPRHVRALARLVRALLGPGPRADLRRSALSTARDVTGADEALWLPLGPEGPVLNAQNAEEAQTLSCVLPAVERALPGRLSLLTSVRVGRDGAWSTVLAPVGGDSPDGYIVLVRRADPFDRESLPALELVCDALGLATRPQAPPSDEADTDVEPDTQAMETPPKPQ